MSAFRQQLAVALRLHFRNKMALIYGYLFPTIFLVSFWMLYRSERVPLMRHMGELLTVTILGGACFGLPTTMVSERERGVWRRYRLTPVSTVNLIGTTVIARYVLLVLAGLLQLGLAMAIGMPLPRHMIGLPIAFTFVAFAFLGLGLVIAMLADNVPAVQALGQCLFLPMLIIGGVAVPLASLPDWALHISAFFPGRYAVQAIQSCVNGEGLDAAAFSLTALTAIGAAGCLTAAQLFRWDSEQRFAARTGKGWLAVALSAWIGVGLLAEARGHIAWFAPGDSAPASANARTLPPPAPVASGTVTTGAGPLAGPPVTPAPATRMPATDNAHADVRAVTAKPPLASAPSSPRLPLATPTTSPAGPVGPPPTASSGPAPAPASPPPAVEQIGPPNWQDVTMKHIDEDLLFTRVPRDSGVVTPIAASDEVPEDDITGELEFLREKLATWQPGKVPDPVQRVRNFLYVAAVPDLFQMSTERFIPAIVFERIQEEVPKGDLIKALYWIAVHPMDGDDKAVDDLRVLGLGNGPNDMEEARQRTAIYAVKLLGRIVGKIKPD